MIGTGVLDGAGRRLRRAHLSEVDAGTVSCEPGPRMANTDWFRIDVRGTSCHGAMPPARPRRRYGGRRDRQCPADHRFARDQPLRAGRHYRGELHGGTARNVIAGTAYLAGTVRTLREIRPTRKCRSSCAASWSIPRPPWAPRQSSPTTTIANYKVENDAALERALSSGRGRRLGSRRSAIIAAHFRARFFEYLRRVPGVLAFVGTRNPKIGATYAQHSCFYKIDETVLAKGSMVAAQYAIDFLPSPRKRARRPRDHRGRRNQPPTWQPNCALPRPRPPRPATPCTMPAPP